MILTGSKLKQQIADDTDRAKRQLAWEAALVAEEGGDDEDASNDVWTVLELDGKSKHGAVLKRQEDGSLRVEGDHPQAAEIEARLAAGRSPYQRAESFAAHELIDPRETRPYLCDWRHRGSAHVGAQGDT